MQGLFYLQDCARGGAQRTVINLANALPAQGIVPVLAIGDTTGPLRGAIDPTLPVLDLEAPHARQAIVRLRGLIRHNRPDFLFSTLVNANVAAWLATRFLPNPPRLILRETNSHRHRDEGLGTIIQTLARMAYRQSDLLIALSAGVGKEIAEDAGIAPHKVTVIPNPVDIASITANAAAARAEPPPWRTDAPMLIAVGRLVRQKGFDILLDAVSQSTNQAFHLTILGDGPDREKLTAQRDRLGLTARVHFAGDVQNPERWLAHAAAFVLSSRWEGFGHVIVEAMASGAPVIATNCPWGPVDIIQNEKNGLLIPSTTAADLAGAMDWMLANPTASRAFAKQAALDCHAYEAGRIAQRYAEIFRQVVSGTPLDPARPAA